METLSSPLFYSSSTLSTSNLPPNLSFKADPIPNYFIKDQTMKEEDKEMTSLMNSCGVSEMLKIYKNVDFYVNNIFFFYFHILNDSNHPASYTSISLITKDPSSSVYVLFENENKKENLELKPQQYFEKLIQFKPSKEGIYFVDLKINYINSDHQLRNIIKNFKLTIKKPAKIDCSLESKLQVCNF